MNTPSNAGKEHNPDGLTPEQVGEGWRLLTTDEVAHRIALLSIDATKEKVEAWQSGQWIPGWNGNSKNVTYRTLSTTPPTQSQEGETPTPITDAAIVFKEYGQDGYPDSAYTKMIECSEGIELKLYAAQRENDRLRSEVAGLKADKDLLDLLEKSATIRWPIVADHRNIAAIAFGVEAAEPFTEKPTVRAILRAATEEGKRG